MITTYRIPQAPREPLPQLEEFLAPFDVQFRRSEGRENLERYLTGLLSAHPHKNCDTIASIVPGTSEQRLQELLTNTVWDENDLNRQRVQKMAALRTEGDGVLIFDDTGFAKRGDCSVGVARQYSGTLGKTGNCQVTVNCHYAERTIAWPVATRLYLPEEEWAHNAARRRKARVPEEITFQTKAEIALDLLDQAQAWGVRYACVTADADYGDNPRFLDGLEGRGAPYVAAVRRDFRVALSRRAVEPSARAEAVVKALPASQWRTIRWREGSRDWLRARFVAVRGWRVDGEGVRKIGWLIGQRPARGQDQAGEWKYFWSNFGPQKPLERMVEYAHRRYWVEQYHEEAKDLLGWDQYQGRLWPGFHRHAVTVMLADSFLVWLEWRARHAQRRRGRPRRPFSPSARSAATITGVDPSSRRRLAAPRGPTTVGTQGNHQAFPSTTDLTKQY